MTSHGRAVLVQLERHATGLLSLMARLGEEPVRLVVDTGASHTVLARKTVARLGLNVRPGDKPLYTYQLAGAEAEVIVAPIAIGSVVLRDWPLPVIDLAFMTAGDVASGDAPIDGMLGVDVLEHCRAEVDFVAPALRLHPPEDDASRRGAT